MTQRAAVVELLRRLAGGAGLEEARRASGVSDEEMRAAFARAAELIGGAAEAATLAPREEAVTLAPAVAEELPTVAPPAEPAAPRRAMVPGYEVIEEIGRGGMGVVYKARHLRLNRTVALKMILAGEHAGADHRARFQREAEAVAALQHPNVVQVFEVGEHDGHSYLALEYVEGGSLASWLADDPWPAGDAALLVEQLARAVEAAHQRGVVHRDLKPENVLLTDGGVPKITDFGLAKRLDDAAGQTRTGEVMGTPNYMAPEQAAGRKDVGPQADVWALGAILHRLLSGKVPFDAPTTLDVLMRVLEEEPAPLRRLNAKAPRDLETVVLKCLSKEPKRRYASAGDLADDLRRFREGEPIRGRGASAVERAWRWSRKHPGLARMRFLIGLVLVGTSLGPPLVAAIWEGPTFVAASWARRFTGPALTGAFLLLLAGFVRARRLPLALGVAGAALASPLALIAAGVAPGWGDSRGVALAPAVGAAAVALGVGIGALFSERWAALLLGAVGLAGAFTVCWLEQTLTGLLAVAGLAVYAGLVTRLVVWRWPGGAIDTACGCIAGSIAGMTLASCCNVMWFMGPAGRAGEARELLFVGAVVLFAAGGGTLGAIGAARASRPAPRVVTA